MGLQLLGTDDSESPGNYIYVVLRSAGIPWTRAPNGAEHMWCAFVLKLDGTRMRRATPAGIPYRVSLQDMLALMHREDVVYEWV